MKKEFFKKPLVKLFGILFLTGLAFSNIFHNDFVTDDAEYIVDWPLIQNFVNLPRFFVGYIPPDGQGGVYSPLKTFFHSLNYIAWQDNAVGYHTVALLIHALGIVMVYLIARRLLASTDVALLAALFFALHPVHVEAVTSMTASIDTLGIVFLLIAFYFYLAVAGCRCGFADGWAIIKDKGKRAVVTGGTGSVCRSCYAAWFFSGLAIFTHELALSLPVLFLFYDVFFGRKDPWGVKARRLIPVFAIAIFYVFLKWWVLGSVTRGGYLINSFPLTMLVMVKAWLKYAVIMFAPVTLTHNHVLATGIFSFDANDFDRQAVLAQSLLELQTALGIIALVGILVGAIFAYRRRPLVTFCVGWFFLCLLPGANIVPSGVYFAERYLYPGSMTFCLLLAVSCFELLNRKRDEKFYRRGGVVLIILIVFFYGLRTWVRNRDWRNQITIYESAVKANPLSAVLRNDLGIVYLQAGDIDKALESFQKAIAINPYDPRFYFTSESAYTVQGDYVSAIQALKQAIALNPDYAEAYYNLVGIYLHLGQADEAKKNFDKAIELFRRQGRMLEAGEFALVMDRFLAERGGKDGGAGQDSSW